MSFLFESQIIDLRGLLPWVRTRREKAAVRQIVEQKRRIMKPEEVKEQSSHIISQIEQMHWFREAKTVLIYYPIHNEVDLRPLLEKYKDEKTFLFPMTHHDSMDIHPYEGEDKMKRGKYNVPEPQTPLWEDDIDLILVPGVVFDQKLHRIGRGGGFYDKFLHEQRKPHKVAVCYDFQVKKHTIPQSWFDKPVDRIVTPTRTIG